MKLLAFAGSNSSQSINRKLVRYALSFIQGAEIILLDLNDYEVPIFSVDREAREGYPAKIYEFRNHIATCDAIVLSLAENNRSYTTAFKNIFDWSSRIDLNIFRNKPMLLMSTSPGNYGGGNVMKTAKSFFPICGADIVETFSLPSFYQNFDEVSGITNRDLEAEFNTKLNVFLQRIKVL